MEKIDYKFNEPELIRQLADYIDGTYDEHYAKGRIQTTEFIVTNGDGVPFTRGNIIKYAQRYGRKDGRNRKDILKILHYALIMLHSHDYEDEIEKLQLEQSPKEINYEDQHTDNPDPEEFRYRKFEPFIQTR